jgi:hypothetical protein
MDWKSIKNWHLAVRKWRMELQHNIGICSNKKGKEQTQTKVTEQLLQKHSSQSKQMVQASWFVQSWKSYSQKNDSNGQQTK